MKYLLTATLACLLLTNCSAHDAGGPVQIDPLPANVAEPCKRPEVYLDAGDWELIAVRIGDELIDCGYKHRIAVEDGRAIREAVSK